MMSKKTDDKPEKKKQAANLLFLDTETTGLDEEARIIQLAYMDFGGEVVNEMFKPNCPIGFEAMAVHHVTEEMVKDKPAFKGSDTYKKLEKQLENHIVVAHNSKFDVGMLEREGLKVKWQIDTKRVAEHIIENVDRYNLQYLRYALGLNDNLKGKITAHDALSDILVLRELFDYLMMWVEGETDKDKIVKMLNLTKQPLLIKDVTFGKHEGKTYEQVAREDRGYLQWLFDSENKKPEHEQNENKLYTLKYHLGLLV